MVISERWEGRDKKVRLFTTWENQCKIRGDSVLYLKINEINTKFTKSNGEKSHAMCTIKMHQFTVRWILYIWGRTRRHLTSQTSQVIKSFSFNTTRYLVRSKYHTARGIHQNNQDMKTFYSCESGQASFWTWVWVCLTSMLRLFQDLHAWFYAFQPLEEPPRDQGSLTQAVWLADWAHWWFLQWNPRSLKAHTASSLLPREVVAASLGKSTPEPPRCIKLPISS